MALTDDQKRDFRELGWFVLGRVFDNDALAELRTGTMRVLAHPLGSARRARARSSTAPSSTCRAPALPPGDRAALVEPMIELLDRTCASTGTRPCRSRRRHLRVPWHQDNGYTPVEPEEYVTCTVALDPTTRENGCLWIQPGSHRRGPTPHPRHRRVLPSRLRRDPRPACPSSSPPARSWSFRRSRCTAPVRTARRGPAARG